MLPVVIIALFSSIQIAVYYLAKAEALSAAQQAITAQRQYQAASGAGKLAANNYLNSGGHWLTGTKVTVDTTSLPNQVVATVTGDAPSLLPWFHFRISQTAHGTVERPSP